MNVCLCFCVCIFAHVMTSRFLVWWDWNRSCLSLLLIAVSHPLTGPEGVRTETTAQGLSVHTHETRAWITQGSKMTHPKEWVEEGPARCFCTNACTYTQRHAARNDSYITGSERGPSGSTHLPQTDVKNKSERSSHWKETAHCLNSTNSLPSKLTGEKTAAHDNTRRWWK